VYFDRAIQIDPKDVKMLSLRGIALEHTGQLAEALQSYDAALKLDPQNQQALFGKGIVLYEQGKHEEANILFSIVNDIFEHDPKHPDNSPLSVKILAVIIRSALSEKVSSVETKKDGEQVEIDYIGDTKSRELVLPIKEYGPVVDRIKILAKMKLDVHKKQKGSFTATVLGVPAKIDATILPKNGFDKVILKFSY